MPSCFRPSFEPGGHGEVGRGPSFSFGTLAHPAPMQAAPVKRVAAATERTVGGLIILGSWVGVALATGAGGGDFCGPATWPTSPVTSGGANSWRALACCVFGGEDDPERWAEGIKTPPRRAAPRASQIILRGLGVC